jgi:hypothetical protein
VRATLCVVRGSHVCTAPTACTQRNNNHPTNKRSAFTHAHTQSYTTRTLPVTAIAAPLRFLQPCASYRGRCKRFRRKQLCALERKKPQHVLQTLDIGLCLTPSEACPRQRRLTGPTKRNITHHTPHTTNSAQAHTQWGACVSDDVKFSARLTFFTRCSSTTARKDHRKEKKKARQASHEAEHCAPHRDARPQGHKRTPKAVREMSKVRGRASPQTDHSVVNMRSTCQSTTARSGQGKKRDKPATNQGKTRSCTFSPAAW